MSDLIVASVLVLHHTPRLFVITVGNFKHRHKLHHPKILCPLSDDACEAFCLLEVDLEREQSSAALHNIWWCQDISPVSTSHSPGSTRSGCCGRETRRWSFPAYPVGQTEGAT